MNQFKIYANKSLEIAKMEDTMFSSFIEHLGRAVYQGIYQPEQKTADADGFRQDVIDSVKQLNLSLVRYPGGNFVSGYFWEDGIGPRENRPLKKEEAWKSLEPNIIGTDEFMKWAKKVNVKPMMAVNLGTGTTDSAANLVEYCNATTDTKYANMRRQYGDKNPYEVKYWGLGNEMDGPWQIGHLDATNYAKKAKEAAQKMKAIDPTIKLIACGSSTIDMPTFPEWDREVLDTLYDDVDYLSIHQYFFLSTTEDDFYASHLAMDKYIDTFRNILKYLKIKHRSDKNLYLCFDEYNIWYNTGELPKEYKVAPAILEENQSVKDTLVFTGLLNSLINNSDVVKVACLAQLINVIAPIMTNDNGVLLNSIWYPYFNYCKYNRGTAIKSFVTEGKTFNSRYGVASYISQSITYNDDEIVLSLTNYMKEDVKVYLTLDGFDGFSLIKHEEIKDDDLEARNTFENPTRVMPKEIKDAIKLNGNLLEINVNKLSYNFIRLKRN